MTTGSSPKATNSPEQVIRGALTLAYTLAVQRDKAVTGALKDYTSMVLADQQAGQTAKQCADALTALDTLMGEPNWQVRGCQTGRFQTQTPNLENVPKAGPDPLLVLKMQSARRAYDKFEAQQRRFDAEAERGDPIAKLACLLAPLVRYHHLQTVADLEASLV